MSDSDSFVIARVGRSQLSKYVDRNVRFVGQVIRTNPGHTAVLAAPDGGEVIIILQSGTPVDSKFIEVIGTVQPDQSIRELSITSFGDDFDMDNFNSLLQIIPKFPNLFHV
ncbi:hypothetical protein H696_01031 [Fonticula alba]|uniref:Replication factor A protein 3 n=1 Tax=Fonticula alba TaxID=691883 RepID=A0A058ZCF4_FONAL|nr:hypothetical protein H696_01031 [Fonticula alba]KCV71613.1 hypothetical protein H696_01031 [Fonticula alba]|eukprot:XP_009493191.1 hypothetical protein H696_01031 [Fonticula alba]